MSGTLSASVSLADALQAVRRLQPGDDETLAAIGRMLNLRLADDRGAHGPLTLGLVPSVATAGQASASTWGGQDGEEPDEDEELFDDEDEWYGDTDLEDDASGEGKRPDHRIVPMRLETVIAKRRTALGYVPAEVPQPTDELHEAVPEPLPLLEPSWLRAILVAALATISHDGPVDMEAMAEEIARGRLPSRVARRAVATLRRGAQVLIDRAPGLVPFARDADQLTRAIMAVLGLDSAPRVFRFNARPWAGLYDIVRNEEQAYRPPPRGVPVILLTDLGLRGDAFSGDFASIGEWLRFFDLLRRAECPVIAFIPYPRSRWPRELAGRVAAIEWDRGTTVTEVRSARRSARP